MTWRMMNGDKTFQINDSYWFWNVWVVKEDPEFETATRV